MESLGKAQAEEQFEIIFSNCLLEAVLQAMLAVCMGISLKEKLSNYLFGGSTASNACSMQGYKNEIDTKSRL